MGLLQDPLTVGEFSGGEGELILKEDALHIGMDTYIGGGNGAPAHTTRGSLSIQGAVFWPALSI
jgi:hypothetical protein